VAPGATINRQDGQSPLTLTGNNAVDQSFCRVTVVVPNDNGTFTPSGINIEGGSPRPIGTSAMRASSAAAMPA
jgi:hypothetical protein